jgi:hypothetical protein
MQQGANDFLILQFDSHLTAFVGRFVWLYGWVVAKLEIALAFFIVVVRFTPHPNPLPA